jgi:hypothetical protein
MYDLRETPSQDISKGRALTVKLPSASTIKPYDTPPAPPLHRHLTVELVVFSSGTDQLRWGFSMPSILCLRVDFWPSELLPLVSRLTHHNLFL